MFNYSIIIPHKNTPDLLQYCIDSIPVRDDVQVIVVDDNSDADKVDFEHFPQWKGINYEFYLTKEGKGAGYARNVGLEHARGKWVLFSDADDFFLPQIDNIFKRNVDSDAEIIFFRPKGVMLSDRSVPSKRGTVINGIIDRYFETGNENELRCWTYTPSCKLIKMDMIRNNNIKFEETRFSNDVMFSVLVGVKAKKISVIDEKLYCITYSSNSLTTNFNNKPGELSIRADVFFRAQWTVYNNGYTIYEQDAIWYLKKVYNYDKQKFFKYYKQMQKMGYEKIRLLKEVFKSNGKKARIKRILFILVYGALKDIFNI